MYRCALELGGTAVVPRKRAAAVAVVGGSCRARDDVFELLLRRQYRGARMRQRVGLGSVGSGVAARRGPRGCQRGQLAWDSQLACMCARASVLGRARGVLVASGASCAGCRPEDIMLSGRGEVVRIKNRVVAHLSITKDHHPESRLWSYSEPLRL